MLPKDRLADDENSLKSIVVMVAQLCDQTKTTGLSLSVGELHGMWITSQ